MRNNKGQFVTRHGKCFSSEYRSWLCMKKRCINPDKKHEKYRGMPISPDWINDFEKFYEDMGPKPTKKHTLDRIDNSKGYSADNCRWATRDQQNRNYSLNKNITINGVTKCVTDWAETYNVPRHRIYQRLARGWDQVKSVTHNLSL